MAPPVRSRPSKSSGPSRAVTRPGAATQRPLPPKSERSLQRVLSNERRASHGPARAISLMRSATAPAFPTLKREASETPSLSSIPTAESQPLLVSRGGVLDSKRFSQREIDVGAALQAPDKRTAKQAKIDAQLREAIFALKKPNRQMAGQTLTDTAEQRSASLSASRSMYTSCMLCIVRFMLMTSRIQKAS